MARASQAFYENGQAREDQGRDEDDAEAAGRKNGKLTDGTFYKKLPDGSYEKTNLKQATVEGAPPSPIPSESR
jgi:hypothetical protein